MQKSKINTIYQLLGCNNTDIAKMAACAPSVISRVRNGSREYKSTSLPVLRFAKGIYLYADKIGSLNSLCKLCSINSANPEEIISSIVAWIFDSKQINLPDLSYILERSKNIKKQNKIYFGEKLSQVMELINISNTRLAKNINVDVSVISRFRNGLRKPKAPTDALLALVLYDRAKNQDKLHDLAKLCRNKNEIIELSTFSEWLYDDTSIDISNLDKLLDSIEHFSLQKTPSPTSIDFPSFLETIETNTDQNTYFGTTGLQDAVIRFLIESLKNGGELYLYSDQNMSWMTSDEVFHNKWITLMTACIKANIKIRIIHNIDRSTTEMLNAIQSWMPLYLTGMISPYICNLERDNRFSKTLFINKGKSCINASILKGMENDGYYEYIKDKTRINIYQNEFDALLANSSPLLNIYFQDDKQSLDNVSLIKSLSSSLSLGSIPEDVLLKMLNRANLTKDEKNKVMAEYIKKKTSFDALNKGLGIKEFTCLPADEDLFSLKIRVPIAKSICSKDIYYTPEEYGSHINAIIKLTQKYSHYKLIILPEMPFSHLQIITTNNNSIVTRTDSLFIIYEFSEPRLLQSFNEYFLMLEEQYETDKNTTIRNLMQFQ